MKLRNTLVALTFIISMLTSLKAQELADPTILDVIWHPTQNWLIIADTDGVRIVDTTTNTIVRTLAVKATPVYTLALNPDNTQLVTGGANGSLELWNVNTGERIADMLGHDGIVNTTAWSIDGSLFASNSASFDGGFLITWNLSTYQPIATLRVGDVTQISWSLDNQQIIAAMRNAGGAIAYDNDLVPESPETYHMVSNAYFDAISIDIHPTNDHIAFGAADGNIYVVDISQDQVIQTLGDGTDFLTRVKWNSDGSQIASVGLDGVVRTWDVNTGELLGSITQSNQLFTLAFSPDGLQIAYGGENTVGDGSSVPIIDAPSEPPPPPTGTFDMQAQISGPDNNQQSQFRYLLTNTSDTAQSDLSVRLYFSDPNDDEPVVCLAELLTVG